MTTQAIQHRIELQASVFGHGPEVLTCGSLLNKSDSTMSVAFDTQSAQ